MRSCLLRVLTEGEAGAEEEEVGSPKVRIILRWKNGEMVILKWGSLEVEGCPQEA